MITMLKGWYSGLFSTLSAHPSARSVRLLPLDALRGLMIVLMALDHANSFIAQGKRQPELWANLFPSYGGDALAFLTRWVTHLAAPGFFFLMGVGMLFFTQSRHQQGWSNWQIARHFMLRGALLILLQFFLENPAWQIGADSPSPPYFGVLYGLGGTMMMGSLFLFLPMRWVVGLLSLLLIVATEFLLPEARRGFIEYSVPLMLWLLPSVTGEIWVLYPIMPWLGVVGLGILFGGWLKADQAKAYSGALWLGAAALLLFMLIRWLDSFGNIRAMQGDDWIAFLNVVKYPPSITFLLLTLGIDLLLLGLFAQVTRHAGASLQALALFGRVPLFFYLTHLYLYGLMGLWIAPKETGIAGMYPYWLLGLLILFPFCWLYGHFKQSRPSESWWRFL